MSYRQPFTGHWPITQHFGETVTDPAGHTGIDYACPIGTSILASNDGVVKFAGYDRTGYGNCVIIQHNDTKATLYAHLSTIKVAVNQHVRQGEKIGESGNTGNSTGPHLHFEARRVWNIFRRESFDPMELPLQNFADPHIKPAELKGPEDLTENVVVACPDGARVFNTNWSMRYTGFPQGTHLHFTGKTVKRPGFPDLTYCEVYEEPRKYYVAVHDGKTQILDNLE